mgnify:CR=1 FL=1
MGEVKACLYCNYFDSDRRFCEKYKREVTPFHACNDQWMPDENEDLCGKFQIGGSKDDSERLQNIKQD